VRPAPVATLETAPPAPAPPRVAGRQVPETASNRSTCPSVGVAEATGVPRRPTTLVVACAPLTSPPSEPVNEDALATEPVTFEPASEPMNDGSGYTMFV